MRKGWIPVLVSLVFLAIPLVAVSEGDIYKIVNPDGSITFTDQKPSPGAEPVQLRPLSIVETDIQTPGQAAPEDVVADPPEPTPRELRRQFRDFAITQPKNEETFWGVENQVTVLWGASQPIQPEMVVILYVNGKAQDVSESGSAILSLERGEHQVYAELRDENNRRIITTETVRFFVKQHSANFNRPRN
ncbi:MAG: hypothetical protein V2I48_11015 [Xanthomonadales bacterium]|jgi:hypothetical protein|nr:hypothetical protein [Xanthomonadales bacterium]